MDIWMLTDPRQLNAMESTYPTTGQGNTLEFAKGIVTELSKPDQQALYEFMHNALNLRIR